jgi:hypothetical protein
MISVHQSVLKVKLFEDKFVPVLRHGRSEVWTVAHRILYLGSRGRKEVSFSPRKCTRYLFDRTLSALQSSFG